MMCAKLGIKVPGIKIKRGHAKLRARRASVSVEFALVSLFFLFPLIAGGVDMTLVLSARSKLNSALHAIYIFAWSDPQNAGDVAQLKGVIQSIDPALPSSSIALDQRPINEVDPSIGLTGNTPNIQKVCLGSAGIDRGATFTANFTTPASPGVAATQPGNACLDSLGNVVTGDVPMVLGIYSLSSVVQLPIPVPFLGNPVTLTASGTIQVQ